MRLAQSHLCLLLLATCGLVGLADLSKSGDAATVACPTNCRCQTTNEGLHKAICFGIEELYKYSLRNKHHNINIIDLSYSNISKVNVELDRFTEMVSIDLSHNEIAHLNKFLSNSRKLVHVNLADNKLKSFSASVLPSSVSSLDLRNNHIKNVPTDFLKLKDLEHVLLEGNPLHCSCENVKMLHSLSQDKIVIDNVECVSPPTQKGKIWIKSNILKDCKKANYDYSSEEMMLGDEPEHETFAPIASSKKSMEINSEGKVDEHPEDHDLTADNTEFIFLKNFTDKTTDVNDEYQGSGDGISHQDMNQEERESEGVLSYSSTETTIYEGSSDDGSGDYMEGSGDIENEENSTTIGPINPLLAFPVIPTNEDLEETTYVTPQRPSIFPGKPDWDGENIGKKFVPTQETGNVKNNEEIVESPPASEDSNVVSKVEEETEEDNKLSEEYSEESKPPQKTSLGTYICIGLIIAFLVGLIGITVIKGQMRKRRDRRQIRQQRTDIEKAGKEMVDMNKSLLGKPAVVNDSEKKVNGNYELVPTHEKIKKPENGNVEKKLNAAETPLNDVHDGVSIPNGNKNQSHVDSNPPTTQNNDHLPAVNVTPLKSEYEPHTGTNGYPEHDSLPYSQDYLPIIPPQDSGRVKIKLTETLKPKTPVLVTRSRSNAGDIIITPAADQSPIYKNPTT